jgi:hypothetical protein
MRWYLIGDPIQGAGLARFAMPVPSVSESEEGTPNSDSLASRAA